MTIAHWEMLSYVVTVFGLPLAIFSFLHEQRKERENEDEEVYQQLSDTYTDFLKLVIENPDLKLRSQISTPDLNEEQTERMQVMFEILIFWSMKKKCLRSSCDVGAHGKTICGNGADAKTLDRSCHDCYKVKIMTLQSTLLN